jgi:hypothetical protein
MEEALGHFTASKNTGIFCHVAKPCASSGKHWTIQYICLAGLLYFMSTALENLTSKNM